MYAFSVNYNTIDVSDVADIHKYLMKKTYKWMFKIYSKQMFTSLIRFSGSSANIAKVPDHRKCISLNNEPFLPRPILIELNPKKLYYHPFPVSLYTGNGNFNTLDDLSGRICGPNRTKDANLIAFNQITRTKESKILTKHILCDYKCKFNGGKCNLNHI